MYTLPNQPSKYPNVVDYCRFHFGRLHFARKLDAPALQNAIEDAWTSGFDRDATRLGRLFLRKAGPADAVSAAALGRHELTAIRPKGALPFLDFAFCAGGLQTETDYHAASYCYIQLGALQKARQVLKDGLELFSESSVLRGEMGNVFTIRAIVANDAESFLKNRRRAVAHYTRAVQRSNRGMALTQNLAVANTLTRGPVYGKFWKQLPAWRENHVTPIKDVIIDGLQRNAIRTTTTGFPIIQTTTTTMTYFTHTHRRPENDRMSAQLAAIP